MSAPGWFQDEAHPWLDRYWDGLNWTRTTRPHLGGTPRFPRVARADAEPLASPDRTRQAKSRQSDRSPWVVVVVATLSMLGIVPVIVAAVFFATMGARATAGSPSPAATTESVAAPPLPSSATAGGSLPSQPCLDAARALLAAEAELNRTHPAVNGADGSYDDYERQLDEIFEPMYWACQSPQDWWETAQVEPAMAGNLVAANLDPAWIEGWCWDRTDDAPMCEDWEGFIASNP